MAASGTVDRDGFKLEWVREGSGLPMLVVGSRSFYPRYFPQSLREHFEMVFCDLRQWVAMPSGFDITTVTRDTFSGDIDALRQAVGFDRPIVVGQSQHGSFALEYARQAPVSVLGVAAIVPFPPAGSRDGLESPEQFFDRDADAGRKAEHARKRAGAPAQASGDARQDFFETFSMDDAQRWYDYTFDASPLWEGVDVNIPMFGQVFSPAVLGGYTVEPLDVPVFLALGRYDYRWPSYVWDEPKRNFSKLTYKLYEKSGHNPPFEQPDEFAADLVAWARTL